MGQGRSGASAPPAPALIHLKSNNGIEIENGKGQKRTKRRRNKWRLIGGHAGAGNRSAPRGARAQKQPDMASAARQRNAHTEPRKSLPSNPKAPLKSVRFPTGRNGPFPLCFRCFWGFFQTRKRPISR